MVNGVMKTEGLGERGRNRTFNLLIKSQLLCQLSYAPGSECGNKEGLAGTSSSPDLSITAPVRFGEDASKTELNAEISRARG